jgi:hypothetical protein
VPPCSARALAARRASRPQTVPSYNYFTGANMNRVPDPGREGARRYLTEGPGASDPRASSIPLDDYFDMRFVERVEASGLVQQLYGPDR